MAKSLKELLNELNAELDKKTDIIIHPTELRMNEDGFLHRVPNDDFGLNHSRNYAPLHWAEGQLANKVGIPTNYFRKCPPELRAINFNHWIEQMGEKETNWLLRTMEYEHYPVIRGVLSEKYSPFDDHEILDILYKILGEAENSNYEIQWWYRDQTGFHLRIIFDDLTTNIGTLEDGSPDVHKVGVHIENSEVGKKSIRITPLVYRLICSNGMMGWGLNKDMEIFTQRHIYLKPHEMYGRVAEALTNALKAGDSMLETLLQAKETPIDDPLEMIKKLSEKAKYSKEYTEKAQTTFLEEEGQGTAFHVIQAFTRSCQDLPSDRRVEIETDVMRFLDEMIA